MIPAPHRSLNLGAWLASYEAALVSSLKTALWNRRFYPWRDRRGRRSGPGRIARESVRFSMVKIIADIRAVRRWRKEIAS